MLLGVSVCGGRGGWRMEREEKRAMKRARKGGENRREVDTEQVRMEDAGEVLQCVCLFYSAFCVVHS